MSDTSQGPGWWLASDGKWYPPEQWTGQGSASGGYAPQGAPYGQAVRPKTNGLAIASLVCSCAGIFLIGIPAVLGIIFGFVARAQIQRSNGQQGGGGMAMAGIIVGFGVVALIAIVFVIAAAQNNQNNDVVGAVTHATALR